MWDSLKSIIKMKHLVWLVLVLFSWLGLFCLFCLWFCFFLQTKEQQLGQKDCRLFFPAVWESTNFVEFMVSLLFSRDFLSMLTNSISVKSGFGVFLTTECAYSIGKK